jgi:CPA2 family monovalent cation:H+ antiporter-2
MDPDVITGLRARGVPSFFGDAANRKILEAAGASRAALVVMTLPEIGRARLAVRSARELYPEVPIKARVHERAHSDSLRADGATELIQPELEASSTLIRHGLKYLGLPKETALAYLERLRDALDQRVEPRVSLTVSLPEVREVRVTGTALEDQSLRQTGIRERFGVTVVTLVRAASGEIVHNPPPETILRMGDRIRVFGLPAQIDALVAAGEAG